MTEMSVQNWPFPPSDDRRLGEYLRSYLYPSLVADSSSRYQALSRVFFRIDQGTPQTVISGIPVFAAGLSSSAAIVSTLAIGTAPLTITSTTVNTNLNADLWDGYQFADYLDQAVKQASSPSHAGLTITGIVSTTPNDFTGTPVAATGPLKFFGYNKSIDDDASITMPDPTTNGMGMLSVDAGATYSIFTISAAGTATSVSSTADVVTNADTDTKVCIGSAAPQDPIQIKNRLGAGKVFNIMFWYD